MLNGILLISLNEKFKDYQSANPNNRTHSHYSLAFSQKQVRRKSLMKPSFLTIDVLKFSKDFF